MNYDVDQGADDVGVDELAELGAVDEHQAADVDEHQAAELGAVIVGASGEHRYQAQDWRLIHHQGQEGANLHIFREGVPVASYPAGTWFYVRYQYAAGPDATYRALKIAERGLDNLAVQLAEQSVEMAGGEVGAFLVNLRKLVDELRGEMLGELL